VQSERGSSEAICSLGCKETIRVFLNGKLGKAKDRSRECKTSRRRRTRS